MILYRILRTDTPTRWDFTSHAERGTEPRGRLTPLEALEWSGLSMFDTIDAVERAASRHALGAFLAMLDIPDDGPVAVAQALRLSRRHHFTLWAEPEMLITFVVRIIALSARGDRGNA